MSEEKRRFNRWCPSELNTNIKIEGAQDEVKVSDVCASGMKVLLPRSVVVGTEVMGILHIPTVNAPFYVCGPVVRQQQSGDLWEAAIRFDRVSVTPLF